VIDEIPRDHERGLRAPLESFSASVEAVSGT
jgi:hypothetical protein